MVELRRINAIAASVAILIATILLLVRYSFSEYFEKEIIKFLIGLFYLIGIVILLFTFTKYIIFNTGDENPNSNRTDIVRKLRLRSLLFNNLSVIILLFILIVIGISFYYLIKPITKQEGKFEVVAGLTVTAVTISLIFLVHISFRVFKYVLRVAAFYNARADAIEYSQFGLGTNLSDLMKLFTPSDYDISDLDSTFASVTGQSESTVNSDIDKLKRLTGASTSTDKTTSKTSLLLKRGQ